MKVEIAVYFYTKREFSGDDQYWSMSCLSAFPDTWGRFFGEELLGQEDGGDQVRGGLGFKGENRKRQVSKSLNSCKCLIGRT